MDLQDTLNVFWELSSQRTVDGMTGFIGAIPFSEIKAYIELHQIQYYNTMLDRIKLIDRIYREIVNE